MRTLSKFLLLATTVATTTASMPFVPVQPLLAVMPLAIIEGGTVSTLPKGAKSHTGKVVVLRGRADRAPAARPRTPSRVAARKSAPVARTVTAVAPAPAKSCACASGGIGGTSASELAEVRGSDPGLRVMMIGPDGLTRTRYVAAPPIVRGANDD